MLNYSYLAYFISSLLLVVNNLSYAQIVADHTMGTVVTSTITETGTNFLISQGRPEGNNLFHSFGDFNLNQHETATFTFTGQETITNILTRVTGNRPSFIDGQIRSDIIGANLYFLNPNGIWFGEHASLNISGSFHASTAKGIKLGEDGEFLANPSQQPTFATAPPSAFGFYDDNSSASIEIQGNSLMLKNRPVPAKQNDTFYAPNGNINVTNNGDLQIEDKTLYAPNGRITIDTTHGKLQLSQSSWKKFKPFKTNYGTPIGNIDVSSNNGGQIFIRAGQLVLDKSIILADSYKDNKGLVGIKIEVDGTTQLTQGAQITADNSGSSQGGQVTIKTDRLQLDGQNPEFPPEQRQSFSRIATNNYGSGKGGNIEIHAPNLEINPGLIQAATNGDGDAGNITLLAQRVMLNNRGFINAGTNSSGLGGNIIINATEEISLSNTSSISVSASSKSSGDAGSVNLDTPQLILKNKGQISSLSLGKGKAGLITLNTDTASLTQESGIYGGTTIFTSKTTSLTKNSGIYSIVAQGKENNIFIQAYNRLYVDNSVIITTASDAQGTAGGLDIQSDGIIILNNSLLVADAVNGGHIFIKAGKFIQSSDSVIEANSVTIDVPEKNLSGSLSGLLTAGSQNLLTLPGLPLSRCASFSKANLSRFIINARDVLPPTPEDLRTH